MAPRFSPSNAGITSGAGRRGTGASQARVGPDRLVNAVVGRCVGNQLSR